MEFRQQQGMVDPMNENARNSSYPDSSKKLLNQKKKSTDQKAKALRDTIRDFSQKVFSKIWMGCAIRRQACLGLPVAYRQVQQIGRAHV